MPKKRRKKQERVVTEFASLTPSAWGRICGLPWTPATRILIGALFVGDGDTKADTACEGRWSRVMQANRLFVKHGLPFRIREYNLSEIGARYTYHIQTLGLRMHIIKGTR